MTDDHGKHRVFRSCLYVPGHHPDRIARAYDTEADAVILDLEDAVPGPRKPEAREIVAEAMATPTAKPTYVRVNSMSSGLCEDDIRAVAGPALAGVRVAKVDSPADVRRVAEVLRELGHPAKIHVLIESAAALEHAFALATASPEVTMLGLGESDLRADLSTTAEGPTMDSSRARVIVAARAAGLPNPCQSVYAEPRDLRGLLVTSKHGRRLGFLGRMAIHPAQIPVIHDVYTPTTNEIDDALEICAAVDLAAVESRSITITSQGRMVGPPALARAKQVLELATALNLITDIAWPVEEARTSESVGYIRNKGGSS
ncbi:HpcH/HpaI aldolase/citrate lyase family protein [Streptomyces malaysiensis]|uniref:HpcH/HpaI aldolase/citrate lyase family protein n=1 Tax=Streptomyces malaysiensis TaxID=92644 RepID=UPI002B27F8B3|nr:CoA ester lyase [Streptomyces malaysiensis]